MFEITYHTIVNGTIQSLLSHVKCTTIMILASFGMIIIEKKLPVNNKVTLK